MQQLPDLYKRTKTGAIQHWRIVIDGSTFYTIEGLVDGVHTTSKPTQCQAKNIGRANATTAEKQALVEAQAKWTRKTEKGFTTDISNVDSVNMHYEPMLAQKYEKYKNKITFPVIINPKLDGIRAVVNKDKALTRNGKQHKSIPHILKALEPFFKKFPNAILDGELYNMDFHDDFNRIASLVRKTKPTPTDLDVSSMYIEYHIYDCPRIDNLIEKDKFSSRFNMMSKHLQEIVKKHKCIKIVEAQVANNDKEVMDWHKKYVKDGYEGIIIRVDGPYENKRSKNLLKCKIPETEEFTILNIREGKGNKKGLAAHADFKTKEGDTFTANIKGPHDYLKKMLKDKDNVINKIGTVRYFNLTPDGIPRFPYLIDVDRWTYE